MEIFKKNMCYIYILLVDEVKIHILMPTRALHSQSWEWEHNMFNMDHRSISLLQCSYRAIVFLCNISQNNIT